MCSNVSGKVRNIFLLDGRVGLFGKHKKIPSNMVKTPSSCEAGKIDTLESAEIYKEINCICTIVIISMENKSVSIKCTENSY